jgi:hypothetical protein
MGARGSLRVCIGVVVGVIALGTDVLADGGPDGGAGLSCLDSGD